MITWRHDAETKVDERMTSVSELAKKEIQFVLSRLK